MILLKKKTERGVPHMPAPRRGCLDYSKVYYDVRQGWFLAWKQNQHITYYIFHIQDTNSEISIAHLYICPYFVWWHRLNHCVALTRADFQFGPCLGKFVGIQYAYINHFGAIMVYKFRELEIPEPFHFNAALSASSCRAA